MNTFLKAAAAFSTVSSLTLWFLYFTLYWFRREKFAGAGRYFDEATLVVHHEQTGVLLLPAVVLSVIAVVLGRGLLKTRPGRIAGSRLEADAAQAADDSARG
ncbi:MAG TPA: hypothetical protein VFR90_13370 [Methylibium sp.]|uniref:hypothetical protein n=1 Tax=Methylibium sp. TaxID=2067992 RepID=UPI002DBF45F9|nr:hypothetical protein [Methylibium sp.]HEU4460106.1 hypothetical protein [Methylibium sp.]